MDFRQTLCAWCERRSAPLESCTACPKYERIALGRDIALSAELICSCCLNRDNDALAVFCRTNRQLQSDSGEPFECYKFRLDAPEAP